VIESRLVGGLNFEGSRIALAYPCVLAGIEAQERGHPVLAGTGYLGGALSRETTLLLAVPYLLLSRRDRRAFSLVALAVLAAWGAWLGIVALASGALSPSCSRPRSRGRSPSRCASCSGRSRPGSLDGRTGRHSHIRRPTIPPVA